MRDVIIGKSGRVLVVAEISANHGQNFRRALALIKKAKDCGADAVKFQVYTPDTITIDVNNKYFKIDHSEWGGQTLYQLYKKAYTPWSWFKKLKRAADDLGLMFFATAFDRTAVDLLEELNVPVHKIASFELVDLALIGYAAKTGKPLILSTGMASIAEIKDAVNAARRGGSKKVILLKCVSSYPAKPEEMNLRVIPHMGKLFHCPVGLSDHTLGIGVAIASIPLGAAMIEKHFTLSRKIKTPDSFFSLEPQELKSLVENVRIAEKSLGSIHYGLTPEEKKNLIFRRSLFVVEDIKKGERFTEGNLKSIRPADGLPPKYLRSILGKRSQKGLKKGTPLGWGSISGKNK
jgi:pseudaminic acid synthase